MNLHDFLIEHVFPKLSQRQLKCVMARQKDVFGFGENSMTYASLGAELGVTTARASQITWKGRNIISYRLKRIAAAQQEPHVIIKKVNEQEANTPNLPMRQMFIYDMGELSTRTLSCLKWANLLLIDQLLEKTEVELLKIPNFGWKSLTEVKELLERNGLTLKSGRAVI